MITFIKQQVRKTFICIPFITSPLFSIGPEYIKDTYLPIATKFRYLSPIHGAMWWEGGAISKYYEFGPREEKDKDDKDWLPKADGPVRLVYALFNLLQGSFGISTNESYPATHLSAKTIAKIVAALEKSQGKISAADIQNIILRDEDFHRSVEVTKKNFAELYKKYKPVLTSIDTKMAELNKEYLDKLQGKDKKTKLTKEQIEELEKENPDIKKEHDQAKKPFEEARSNINKELGKQNVEFLFNPIILETEVTINQKYQDKLNAQNIELKTNQDKLTEIKLTEEIKRQINELNNKVDSVTKKISKLALLAKQEQHPTTEEQQLMSNLKIQKEELNSQINKIDPRIEITEKINSIKTNMRHIEDQQRAELVQFKKISSSGGQPGARRVFELSQAIVDSYNDTSNLYPSYCTYYILTAFMYRKAHSKQEFLDYFDTLNKELGEIFESEIARNDWLNSRFDESELPGIKKNLWQWIKNPEMEILTNKWYEEAIYGQIIERFYKSNFPKAAGYATVIFGQKSFPDCAETTLRNLCNIILYDKKSGIFDLAQYKTIDPNSAFFKFYQKNRSATELEKHAVYQEWTEVIENQPWITYIHMVDSNNLVTRAPKEKKGFVVIPEDLTKEQLKELIKLDFIPIDGKTKKGFEVAASLRNIIILLNHFFGLSLFTDLKQDFLKFDFNETYLLQLTNKIDKLSYPTYDEKTVDSNDFSAGKHIILKFADFSVNVTKGHAELTIDYKLQNIVDLEQIIINRSISNFDFVKNYLTLNLLSIYQLSIDQFNELYSQSKKVEEKIGKKSHVFSFIFFTDLFENNARVNILSKYLIPNMLSHDEILSRACTLTAFPMLKVLMEQPDLIYFNRAIDGMPSPVESIGNFIAAYAEQTHSSDLTRSLNILAKILERKYETSYQIATHVAEQSVNSDNVDIKKRGLDVFEKLGELNYEKAFEVFTNAAEKAITSTDEDVQRAGLKLFGMLVEKNYEQAFETAINAAEMTINSTERQIQLAGIRLFVQLVEKNYENAFERATNAAERAINSIKWDVQDAGFELFDKLFGKNYQKAFEIAANIAEKAINSTNYFERLTRFQLFGKLFKYGKAFEVSTNAAEKAITSTNKDVQKAGLILFGELVEKNYEKAFDKATNAAEKAINSEDEFVQEAGLGLFGMLVEHGKSFELAANAAEKAITSTNKDVQKAGLILFGELFEKNYEKVFDKATNAAEKAINSEDEFVQEAGLGLFGMLVEHGKSFELSTNAAEKAITSTNKDVQKAGLILFGKLVEKNYEKVFEIATNAAEKAINSEDEVVQEAGLKLFGKLVKKNYEKAFDKATNAAEEAINSEDEEVHLESTKLFGKLVEKNYDKAFELAANAAEKAINSKNPRVKELGEQLKNKLKKQKELQEKIK